MLRYLLKQLTRMFDISYSDVIYYVINVICSHYVKRAIIPLFDWASSYFIHEHVTKYFFQFLQFPLLSYVFIYKEP